MRLETEQVNTEQRHALQPIDKAAHNPGQRKAHQEKEKNEGDNTGPEIGLSSCLKSSVITDRPYP